MPTNSGPTPTPSRVMDMTKIAVAWASRVDGNRWVMALRHGVAHHTPKKPKAL
ncbi:hypothetical protein D3C87_1373300 [compost metagenome]